MTGNGNHTVREIAIGNPAAIPVFESFGIDYCCGGARSLEEACVARSVPMEKVLESLTAASREIAPQEAESWLDSTLTALADYIVEKHHDFVKRETPRLLGLLKKVRDKHGASHAEILTMEQSFQAITEELRSHMFKEERILFPYVKMLETAAREGGPAPRGPFGDVTNPIRMMMAEHDSAGELLKQIRLASGDFTLPETACPTYSALYRGLEAFERDLHVHIHLENNILFPRSVELERRIQENCHAR